MLRVYDFKFLYYARHWYVVNIALTVVGTWKWKSYDTDVKVIDDYSVYATVLPHVLNGSKDIVE